MKKSFFFLLLIPLLQKTAKEWVTVRIDSRVSLSFPNTPAKTTEGKNTVWTASDTKAKEEGNIRCMATITDLGALGMTPEKMSTDLANPATINEFGNGILGKIRGGKMIAEKQTQTLGYPSFEFLIDMGKQPLLKLTTLHAKSIFIGTTMYNLYVYEAPSKPLEASRNRFFESLSIRNN